MRALFINDLGFQYGAGIAHLRQIQSFLLMGWEVAALCWDGGETQNLVPYISPNVQGKWLGIVSLPNLHNSFNTSSQQITDALIHEAQKFSPDVAIVGNVHGAEWPPQILSSLTSLNSLIVYMHDSYWITGRCAYTGSCDLYKIGCNHNCPTWEQYPSLAPDKIFDAWRLRRDMFCGPAGIPIATNSEWLLNQVNEGMPNVAKTDCVYLGLDEQLFQPIDKLLARKLLGISPDSFVILGGAVNVADFRKGSHIFQELFSLYKNEKVHFLIFGKSSEVLVGAYSTGLLRDYRKMPLVYSSADLFVSTSLEESFGQTLCEAAACGIPSIAFRVGGVPEIARDGINARLVDDKSAEALANEIEFFRQNSEACFEYGKAGRQIVGQEFTLQAQGERWMQYLQSLSIVL